MLLCLLDMFKFSVIVVVFDKKLKHICRVFHESQQVILVVGAQKSKILVKPEHS